MAGSDAHRTGGGRAGRRLAHIELQADELCRPCADSDTRRPLHGSALRPRRPVGGPPGARFTARRLAQAVPDRPGRQEDRSIELETAAVYLPGHIRVLGRTWGAGGRRTIHLAGSDNDPSGDARWAAPDARRIAFRRTAHRVCPGAGVRADLHPRRLRMPTNLVPGERHETAPMRAGQPTAWGAWWPTCSRWRGLGGSDDERWGAARPVRSAPHRCWWAPTGTRASLAG
jgi:hypothetical protein